ncbi:MAG: TIGR02206 family membrane protein [Anaerolineales bacterium]|nr:TIGR02206 family membrane protein [Anaerolineales bacterium]
MAQYFSLNYAGGHFQLFGIKHLVALASIALICLSFFHFRNVWSERQKNAVRLGLGLTLALNELALHIWSAYWGIWNVQTMLPLHLCSVMVWVTVSMTLSKNYQLYDFAYFLGMGGAIQALLTPADASAYDFPHFRILQTFISHGLLVIIPIYLTVVEGLRPTLHSFKRLFLWANVYLIIVFFINRAIGSNYLFTAQKPPSPTLMDALSPWPWYIPEAEVLAFLVFLLLYLPFFIQDRRAVAR